MLEQIDIQEYALIDHLTINFDKGLTILSGETGAGKSILAGAIGLLVGLRGDTSAIRGGSEEAVVAGIVRVEGSEEAGLWLQEQEINIEDGTVLVRRSLKKSGRGSIYIQKTPVTRSQLMEFMSLLFDIHGQHEHQSLLVVDNHRKLLDRFGGLEKEAAQFSRIFSRLSQLRREYSALVSSERDRLREIDILKFTIEEIQKAELKTEEEDTLKEERKKLQQSEKLYEMVDISYSGLGQSGDGVLGSLRSSMQSLGEAAGIDKDLSALYSRFENAFFEIEDIAESIRGYKLDFTFSPEKLESCEERLALIHSLEKKYGNTINDVLAYCAECEEKLVQLENWETNKEILEKEITSLERRVLDSAEELSKKRTVTAQSLEEKIEDVLHTLGMPKARFTVHVMKKMNEKGKPVCGSSGFDSVEFMISPNQGEEKKPLKSIASGGEISRIMLAIKSVLTESDHVKTLIFDEIDAGIGGAVAIAVGEHLLNLAGDKQVLCITHLATIAVRADNHLKIEKNIYDNRTVTRITVLEGREKVKEISRMLAGDMEGKTSLSHAEELLQKYQS